MDVGISDQSLVQLEDYLWYWIDWGLFQVAPSRVDDYVNISRNRRIYKMMKLIVGMWMIYIPPVKQLGKSDISHFITMLSMTTSRGE